MGSFAPIAHPFLSLMSLWNKPLCKASKGARTAAKKKAKLKKDGMMERMQMTTIDHLCLFLLYAYVDLKVVLRFDFSQAFDYLDQNGITVVYSDLPELSTDPYCMHFPYTGHRKRSVGQQENGIDDM